MMHTEYCCYHVSRLGLYNAAASFAGKVGNLGLIFGQVYSIVAHCKRPGCRLTHVTAVQGGVKLLRQLTLTRGDADVIAAGAPGLLALLNDEGQVTGGANLPAIHPLRRKITLCMLGAAPIDHCAPSWNALYGHLSSAQQTQSSRGWGCMLAAMLPAAASPQWC